MQKNKKRTTHKGVHHQKCLTFGVHIAIEGGFLFAIRYLGFQFCIFALVLPAMDGEKPNIFLYIL